ncbi:hypothetical protein KFL01_28700 [Kocuria flava]|uniref:Uncharacterized protein n=1 Tax=Kocuria flava TaxID=446860 RepID=A0ABQ0X8X5_9MICC|nr:hypothetical protein KFL01_28700 [Kocuria flava]
MQVLGRREPAGPGGDLARQCPHARGQEQAGVDGADGGSMDSGPELVRAMSWEDPSTAPCGTFRILWVSSAPAVPHSAIAPVGGDRVAGGVLPDRRVGGGPY